MKNAIKFYNYNLGENNKEFQNIIKLCDENNNKVNNLSNIFKNEMEKIEKFYKNVYVNSNNNILKKINEIISNINEQINKLNINENNINTLTNEMNDVIKTLLIKLDFKEKAINKLKKEKEILSNEKMNSDNKNLSIINELKEDINKYKNKILSKDKIIKIHLDNEISIKATIEEITQQITDNNNIVIKLNQKYNDDLSKFSQYYNNIILFQNKNILNVINNNEISIEEIKSLLKNSEDEVDDLVKKYKELNDKYFDKCCSLLNKISDQDLSNKMLNNKISSLEVNNSKLKEEKNKLEEENISIINDK